MTTRKPMHAMPVEAVVLAVSAVALLCGGCQFSDPDEPHPCTAIYVAGVSIEVTDAGTGFPAACGAVLYVTEGAYAEADSGICLAGRPDEEQYLWLSGAYERAGVYDLRIEKDGYVAWEREGVVVTADACHVRTVHLAVALQPLP